MFNQSLIHRHTYFSQRLIQENTWHKLWYHSSSLKTTRERVHFLVRPPTSEKVLYQSVLLHFVLNSETQAEYFHTSTTMFVHPCFICSLSVLYIKIVLPLIGP